MQISVKTANEVKVLTFEGSLDTLTSPVAQTQLTQLIEGGDIDTRKGIVITF